MIDVIPEDLRGKFKNRDVYIRSIAEEKSHLIYYLSLEVELPDYCLHPINKYEWIEEVKEFTTKDLMRLSGNYSFTLQKRALYQSKIIIGLKYPNPKVKGYKETSFLEDFKYREDADGPHVLIALSGAKKIIEDNCIKSNTKVTLLVQYVPK